MDPRFLVCAPFEIATAPDLHAHAWVTTLGPALHPAIDADLVDVFKTGRATDTTAVDTTRKKVPAEPPSLVGAYDPHVEHVEKMVGLVDAACRRGGAVYVGDVRTPPAATAA